jgi:small subunit ribosomal protein S35
MGEEHPAENKISLEFCTADLPLTPKQRLKLVKLLGARYNPQTDLARLSCEMFPESAQNKRYLGDLVDTLMEEARCESSAEGGKDAFDDVPVDFRHVKWQNKPQFPEAWNLTPERRAMLMDGWTQEIQRQKQSLTDGTLVDGAKVIGAFQNPKITRREPAPALV